VPKTTATGLFGLLAGISLSFFSAQRVCSELRQRRLRL
jgi:hypothetical protein